jgi:hypothetical protein
MAGTGIRSFANLHGQMPGIATIGIATRQTALNWTADCPVPRSGCQEYMRPGKACGNLLSNSYFCLRQSGSYSILGHPQSKRRGLPHSTICGAQCGIRLKTSPRHFTSRIPCFKCHIFLPTRRIV